MGGSPGLGLVVELVVTGRQGFGEQRGARSRGDRGKTLQRLRTRACGGGNKMMSWKPRGTAAQAELMLMGHSPTAFAGWGSGQGWKRSVVLGAWETLGMGHSHPFPP